MSAVAAADARVLGQLLVMQSVVTSLPDKVILPFVIQALGEIPGAGQVEFHAGPSDESAFRFPLTAGAANYGTLNFRGADTELFAPYLDHIGNFTFMLALILDERRQRQVIELHGRELEQQVAERTAELARERDAARRYLDVAGVMLMALDSNGRIAMINKKGTEILGRAEKELIGTDWFENFIPADGRAAVRGEFSRLISEETRSLANYENRIINATGQERVIAWNNTLLRNETGSTTGILSSAEDITERKQATEALRESEERWQFAIEGSGDGVWDWNLQTGEATFSKRWKEMLGFAENEIENRSEEWVKRVHPEDMPGVMAKIQEHFDGKAATAIVEFRMLAKDGSWKWILGRGIVVRRDAEGKPLRLVGTNTDVTERKRAVEALRASEEKFAKAFRSSPMFISISDVSEGRYIDVNEGFLRATEHTRAEVIGHTSGDIALWKNPQDRQDAINLLLEHGSVRGFEAELCKKSGEPMVCEIWAEPIELGEKPCVIWVTNDVTERKWMEEINLQAQKMESLGTLAGGVAHDFNNIIAAIMGNAELVRQDLGPVHKALESLEEIRKASRRAKDLVQQILAFGRKQATERKVISLEPAVQEAGRLLRSTLPAGVRLKVQCDSDAPTVLADATQIQQILLNLCANAWQAMESDKQEATIEVRLQLHEQAVSATPDAGLALAADPMLPGRYACLAVQDNGSGMDKTTLTRIFEPFFTTKPVGKGTGLGLSVVHNVAQDHGASVQVRSVPGKGSTFCIYFPAAQATGDVVLASTTEGVPVHGQGKHILYIDDDEAIVFLMTRLLERQGYRVSGFTEAQAALAAVRSNPGQFDLAVTDYNMPVMSGLEVARALKTIRPDLPVALASGYITDELRLKAPAAGVSELIYKPNTAEDLCEAVARLANARSGG